MDYGPEYEKYSDWYKKGWCRIDQLRKLTAFGRITPAGFEAITGEPYETPV